MRMVIAFVLRLVGAGIIFTVPFGTDEVYRWQRFTLGLALGYVAIIFAPAFPLDPETEEKTR